MNSAWLFAPVHPQMHIQLVQFNQGKVAVTPFKWFFSALPHIACLRESAIFVNVFPQNVYFQIACLDYKITSLTLGWFFLSLYFKWIFNVLLWTDAKNTLDAFLWFYPVWILKCFPVWPTSTDVKLHWLHLFGLSPVWVQKCVHRFPVRRDT